jgi:hypothetical protein
MSRYGFLQVLRNLLMAALHVLDAAEANEEREVEEEGFEIVEAAPAEVPEIGRSSWDQRLAHARAEGLHARRLLQGHPDPAVLDARNEMPPDRFWIVVRTSDSGVLDPVCAYAAWHRCAAMVCVHTSRSFRGSNLAQASIVAAFASKREVEMFASAGDFAVEFR